MKPDKKGWLARTKEKETKLKEEIESSGSLGKGDTFAMIISALLTFVPICAVVIGLLSLFMLWIFRAI